jgi:hypothetical protein
MAFSLISLISLDLVFCQCYHELALAVRPLWTKPAIESAEGWVVCLPTGVGSIHDRDPDPEIDGNLYEWL